MKLDTATPSDDVTRHAPVTMRLDRDALIEEGPGMIRVYGRWDTVFGAWIHSSRTGRSVGSIPNFPLVDGFGEPASQLPPPTEQDLEWWEIDEWSWGIDLSLEKFNHIATTERRLIAEYVRLIPTRFRKIAANIEGSKNQWLVLAGLWADAELSTLLEVELAAIGSSFIEACLVLQDLQELSPSRTARFLRDVLTAQRTTVLGSFAGTMASRASVRRLCKATSFDGWTKDSLLELLALEESSIAGRLIQHRRSVDPSFLQIIGHVSEPFAKAPWLIQNDGSEFDSSDRRLSDGCPYQNVDYTIECLTRAASIYRYMESGSLPLPKNWRDRIDRRVRSSELPSQLASDLHEVIQQALDDETTWQPPPWLGSDVFIPVTRYGDLRTVARRFQNCALSRIGSLLTGASCLFVAKTGPDVLIEIARTNVVDGWKIREVQAIDRRAVDPSLLAQFIAEFQAGISLPLDASLDHVAGLK